MSSQDQSKSHRFYIFLKRFSFLLIMIFIITFFQIYWSMGTLSDHMSSGCPDCSFFEDAVFMALIAGIFLSVVFSLLFFIKKIFLKACIEFLVLIFVWLFWNYSLFVDRESSWSTYDFNSEIQYTVSLSFFPVILLGCLCIMIIHYRKIKVRFVSAKK